LARAEVPEYMQGIPFISGDLVPKREVVYGTSDRVDEAFEMTRTLRSEKFRYIRNFYPHLPLLQPNFYTDQSMIMEELFRVKEEDTENEAIRYLFQPERKPEELYDIENDPYELHNLAYDPRYRETLLKFRKMLNHRIQEIFDTGFMPEPVMNSLSEGSTPYETARNPEKYYLPDILAQANLGLEEQVPTDALISGFLNDDPLVRYWSVVTVEARDITDPDVTGKMADLLDDPSALVRIETCRALLTMGHITSPEVITKALTSEDPSVLLYAARAFEQVASMLPAIPDEVLRVYRKLETQTAGKWYGYDLYAYWALREVLD